MDNADIAMYGAIEYDAIENARLEQSWALVSAGGAVTKLNLDLARKVFKRRDKSIECAIAALVVEAYEQGRRDAAAGN